MDTADLPDEAIKGVMNFARILDTLTVYSKPQNLSKKHVSWLEYSTELRQLQMLGYSY